MSSTLILVVALPIGLLLVWGVLRLFTGKAYRPGPENGWAQRNDLRRESRGPDDYIGNPTGGDAIGGVSGGGD